MNNKYALVLKDTTWIVPPATLLAYKYSAVGYTAVADQTVWIIDNYESGYFFGTSYTSIMDPPHNIFYVKRKLLGTVTEEGQVYITFIPMEDDHSVGLVNGIGVLSKEHGNYQFIMQMNSGSNEMGISHWSYMIDIKEESPYYQSLPGTHQSLPEFLANF